MKQRTMRPRPVGLWTRVFGMVGASLLVGAPAFSQPVVPVAPVGLAPIAPPVDVEQVGAIVADDTPANLDALLGRLKDGSLSVDDAVASKQLTGEEALYMLSYRLHPWGGFGEGWEVWWPLRRAVAKVVVDQAPQLLEAKNMGKLSPQARLWIADYLGNVGDERCVPLCESVLAGIDSQIPIQGNDNEALIFQVVERLGWFYRDTQQHQMCATAWLQLKNFAPMPKWMMADMYLESARELEKIGPQKVEEVKHLRQGAIDQHNGWRTALVFYDEYLALKSAGKNEEARRALAQPLQATEAIIEGRVAQNAWLASDAYQAGDLNETMRLSSEALQLSKNADSLSETPAKGLYVLAHDLYLRAGGWKTQPIQCDVKEIVLKTNPLHPDAPLYARFRIKTYGDQSVSATVDNPIIQVRVLPISNWQRSGLEAQEKELEVIIQSKSDPVQRRTNIVLQVLIGSNNPIRVPIYF